MNTNRTALEAMHEKLGTIEAWDGTCWVTGKSEALQALLADILAFDVMQDESTDGKWIKEAATVKLVVKYRNQVRKELRVALQVYFMGGDVGVDNGDSK